MANKLQIDTVKLIVVMSNSGSGKKTKREWLPGGTLSIFTEKWANYITNTFKDRYS